jgi:hypothetical protein
VHVDYDVPDSVAKIILADLFTGVGHEKRSALHALSVSFLADCVDRCLRARAVAAGSICTAFNARHISWSSNRSGYAMIGYALKSIPNFSRDHHP